MIHLKPDQRTSFGVHGLHGWYIGPALDHYRCYTCFVPSTNTERHPDTVDFFPVVNPIPFITTYNYLRQAANDILYIPQHPQRTIPSLMYGNKISNVYIHLAQILKQATVPPPTAQEPASIPRVLTPLRVVAPPRVHDHVDSTPNPTGFLKLILPKQSEQIREPHIKIPTKVLIHHHDFPNLKLKVDNSTCKNTDIYSHRYSVRPPPYLRRSYNEQNTGQAQAIIAHPSGYEQHVANHVFHTTSGAK